MSDVNVTFSSCLYHMKNRHGSSYHTSWMRGFIRIVKQFYLVIYTDEETSQIIIDEIHKTENNIAKSNIRVIIKPYTEFYNYKYAEYWKRNNDNPECKLYNVADWRLNMLWCEKVHFVHQTVQGRYFGKDTEYYGWCDIGYFRDTLTTTTTGSRYANIIREHWPNPAKMNRLDKSTIYYGCNIRPNDMNIALKYYLDYFHPSNLNSETGLPRTTDKKNTHFISGGFFITGREKVKWWVDTFQTALEKYITHNAVIQDDQLIISYCVFKNNVYSGDDDSKRHFSILKVNETEPDKLWFMFRDLLL